MPPAFCYRLLTKDLDIELYSTLAIENGVRVNIIAQIASIFHYNNWIVRKGMLKDDKASN
jgi:hypothetical protein